MSPRYEVPLRAILLVASSMLLSYYASQSSPQRRGTGLLSLSTISLSVCYFVPILFAALHRRKMRWEDKELVVTELVAIPWCVYVIGLLCVPHGPAGEHAELAALVRSDDGDGGCGDVA